MHRKSGLSNCHVICIVIFIPMINLFTRSILFENLEILIEEPDPDHSQILKRIDPLNGFTMGMKNIATYVMMPCHVV